MSRKLTNKEENMWNAIVGSLIATVAPKLVDSFTSYVGEVADELISDFEKLSILDEVSKFFNVNQSTAMVLPTAQKQIPAVKPKKVILNRKKPDYHDITLAEYQYICDAHTWFNEYNVHFFAAGKQYHQTVLVNTLNNILGLDKSLTPLRNVWSTKGTTLECERPDVPPTFDSTYATFIGVLESEGTKFAAKLSTSRKASKSSTK